MLRWVDMPFIHSPSVGIKARNTKWLQSLGVRFPEACFACLEPLLSLV
jgi:hypothetical protein